MERLSRLKKEHTKEFQVSYETLLFMAKVKEYGYGMCFMTEKGEYLNEPLNDVLNQKTFLSFHVQIMILMGLVNLHQLH